MPQLPLQRTSHNVRPNCAAEAGTGGGASPHLGERTCRSRLMAGYGRRRSERVPQLPLHRTKHLIEEVAWSVPSHRAPRLMCCFCSHTWCSHSHLVFESCSSLREEVGWPEPALHARRPMLYLFPYLVFPHPVFGGQPKFGMEVAPRPALAGGLPYATLPGKGGLVFSRRYPSQSSRQRYISR